MSAAKRFQKVEELFHAALKLPPAERRGFLCTQCPDDESLRRQVESLLAEDAGPSGSVETRLDNRQVGAFALAIGTRFGPYEIAGTLGAGGMGHVYRARDTKLHRDVAVKVLPQAFANAPEQVSRFEREARMLAALNHPHIAAIFDLEEVNGGLALVMELVEGCTLAERIAAGPVPMEEALEMGRQISAALEAAHERGIIHRDLKPANVKVTPEGEVKVLDFGLAKALKSASAAAPAGSPAETAPETQSGIILGTAAYMSPEQARGAVVDRRSDIWAFGVVLYEMLTGQRLFAGATISDTLAAVLTQEPDWNRVPKKARKLVRRCLERDPKRRLRDIADAWDLLEDASPAAPPRSRLPWALAGALAGTLAATLLFASWMAWHALRPNGTGPKPLVRVDVDLGNGVSLGSLAGADVILSPDGSRLVYCSQSRLFTRPLDQPEATELAGTEGAYAPFFSPDGQWVAFFVPGELKKVSVNGGQAVTLCNFAYSMGGSWGEDGDIIAARLSSGLFRIHSTGGTPTPVTELARGEVQHRWPQVLPGGKSILFAAFGANGGSETGNIEVLSPGGHRRTIHRGASWARYVASGHLLYLNGGTLFAAPFNLARLEMSGPPVPILPGVAYDRQYGSAQFDVSQTGMAAYRSRGAGGLITVQWLDGAGKLQPLIKESGEYRHLWLSPDAERLALSTGPDCWIYELRRGTVMPWTFRRSSRSSAPIWTPDGRFFVFSGAGGMFWAPADGGTRAQPLTQSDTMQYPFSFTSDGKRLAFNEFNPETGVFGIWTVTLENNGTDLRAGKPEAFLRSAFNERQSSFSPDGRWVAYTSNESGVDQVYVRAFPDAGRQWQISIDGGLYPLWSRKGHQLYFRTADNRIMAADYTVNGSSFQPALPKLWFAKRLADVGIVGRNYDVAPDGRIAALMPVEGPDARKGQDHVIFLFNFFDELRRRVSAR